MSAESSFYALLMATPAVTALVAGRISADRIEQGTARPFVVFTRSQTDPLQMLDGTVPQSWVTLEVMCWADTRVAANAVADAVTAAILNTQTHQVTGRNSAFDGELDLEASVLTIQWWE